VLWSISTVHHWHDIDRGVAEAGRVLGRGGRFLAIERRTRAGAKGHASHGWTPAQADAFAQRCRAAGYVDAQVETVTLHKKTVLAVHGTAP
jgi:ubiquinone/menaquinone biosynthesis C-methylase UbiE